MLTEFKLKIESKKNAKLHIEELNLKKLFFKVKGITKDNTKFYANITVKFCNDSNKIIVKKINITHLEVLDLSDESSYIACRNIYTLNNITSSSCSSSNDTTNVYNQLKLFTKNIKLITKNNSVEYIIFSLNNTHIKKMKLKGKLI